MADLFKWHENTVLLTGATGFLGRELLLRLLQAEVKHIYLLIRGDAEAREKKFQRALDSIYPDGDGQQAARERITVLQGDIAVSHMGLSSEDLETVLAKVDHIVHCAANVSFGVGFSDHFAINLGGTRHALDLAEALHQKGRLKKVDYIGTAYVAGAREGFIREDELDKGQGFHNSYEESKFQAEQEILRRGSHLPITRFRPSVVMGDQKTGRTSNFMMVYWLVKVYADRWWRVIPGVSGTVVDIVPVDFVTDAIIAISPQPQSVGQAYHLAAGPDNATSVDELCRLVERFFKWKPIRIAPFDLYVNYVKPVIVFFAPKQLKKILNAGTVYEPYFKMRKLFDTANTDAALAHTDIRPTPVTDYFNTLFEFAIETDWGKKPLQRGTNHAAPSGSDTRSGEKLESGVSK